MPTHAEASTATTGRNPKTHHQLADFIWSICISLRGAYKRNEYRRVVLPLTLVRRFDSLLEPTKERALARFAEVNGRSGSTIDQELRMVTGLSFYNTCPYTFAQLANERVDQARRLTEYISGFSQNVREILERFDFGRQIARLREKQRLAHVLARFAEVDLSPAAVDNEQMGYLFERLIRIGAEQSNEEAGEHFTPREVVDLMVDLLLGADDRRWAERPTMSILDPACGTGGMLSGADAHIRRRVPGATPELYGQDLNAESWAVCRSDMMMKGYPGQNIHLGNSLTDDAFPKHRFELMLANPPFGVDWKGFRQAIEADRDRHGLRSRFVAGLPRAGDGSLLFLQHMLQKVCPAEEGGSRIGIIFNASPLFAGDPGSGESEIRRWIISNDLLEAIVALPDDLFYNTGISTYIWILSNVKEPRRRGAVQLIDARYYARRMKRSLGSKRNTIGADQVAEIVNIYRSFSDGEQRTFEIDGREATRVVSRVLSNDHFGFRRITVDRPLRLAFHLVPGRVEILESVFATDCDRLEELTPLLGALASRNTVFRSRAAFRVALAEIGCSVGVRLTKVERGAIEDALGERDETAEPCLDRHGHPEPDPELRGVEEVPLNEDVSAYLDREVLAHVPDAWPVESRTRVGCEIRFKRAFYHYEPPRPLEEIEAEIRELGGEVLALLAEVTSGFGEELQAADG